MIPPFYSPFSNLPSLQFHPIKCHVQHHTRGRHRKTLKKGLLKPSLAPSSLPLSPPTYRNPEEKIPSTRTILHPSSSTTENQWKSSYFLSIKTPCSTTMDWDSTQHQYRATTNHVRQIAPHHITRSTTGLPPPNQLWLSPPEFKSPVLRKLQQWGRLLIRTTVQPPSQTVIARGSVEYLSHKHVLIQAPTYHGHRPIH